MNERLKLLRKNLSLSQETFGKKIGVTKASISRLESGTHNFTKQMTKSICREFNVNYTWFTTGQGEMFSHTENDYMNYKNIDNDLNYRIKQIRKLSKLTQEEFGKRLGVTKAAISKIEANINQVTEQTFKLICKEFNVNPMWLSTGKGEIFTNNEDDYIDIINRIMSSSNSYLPIILKVLVQLNTEDWNTLKHIIFLFLEDERKHKK